MKQAHIESHIGREHYTDKEGVEIDFDRGFNASAGFEKTIISVHRREARLARLLETDPSGLEDAELIRAYNFGKRLVSRTIQDREDAKNPNFEVGAFTLKEKEPGFAQSERDKLVAGADNLLNLLHPRIEAFEKELIRRGRAKKSE